VARDRFTPVGKGLGPTKPLELFQIDHTLADVILVDEFGRRPLGRPWLTLVIDVATRMIAGFHLSLDASSATSVALAISHAVLPKNSPSTRTTGSQRWPVRGLPHTVLLDNAKEFHSDGATLAQSTLNNWHYRGNVGLFALPAQVPGTIIGHIGQVSPTLAGDDCRRESERATRS